MMTAPNCPCPKRECPQHSNCIECVRHHKEKSEEPYCAREFTIAKHSDEEGSKNRERIQSHFWSQVGAKEHISLPMLENAIKKEFNCKNTRSIRSQVNLMQNEGRIRVESRVKVWIKPPNRELET